MSSDPELLDLLGRAAQAVESGELAAAEDLYRKAAEMGHGPAMSWIAARYHKTGQFPEAESWYLRAIEQHDAAATLNLASLYEQFGQRDAAARLYAKAASGGDPVSMAHRARFLSSIGESEEAITEYRKAIANLERPSARAHFELGNVLAGSGRWSEAQSEFQAAMALGDSEFGDKARWAIEGMNDGSGDGGPTNQASRLKQAMLLLRESNFAEARGLFEEIIDSDNESVLENARLGLAELEIAENDPASAEPLYREVLRSGRSDLYGYAWLGIATCLVLIEEDDERDEEALLAYARAIECGPDEISVRARSAVRAIRNG